MASVQHIQTHDLLASHSVRMLVRKSKPVMKRASVYHGVDLVDLQDLYRQSAASGHS